MIVKRFQRRRFTRRRWKVTAFIRVARNLFWELWSIDVEVTCSSEHVYALGRSCAIDSINMVSPHCIAALAQEWPTFSLPIRYLRGCAIAIAFAGMAGRPRVLKGEELIRDLVLRKHEIKQETMLRRIKTVADCRLHLREGLWSFILEQGITPEEADAMVPETQELSRGKLARQKTKEKLKQGAVPIGENVVDPKDMIHPRFKVLSDLNVK
eukprot:3665642-Amphidinium_carterae.1